ncbi:hypothetical protein JH06_0693 [Blastocystis sp. subtype 4]|uniref:hypothetical protein n=1 Tax=Blastocystis sp. subtype 4 TaxID=944170 RepID=UPI0007119A51|nr:hypothetical protein JH06_0693 [Blastocystis sp. subtype 4]KNB45681.1 hypothetical protein JH06_0693 [Blastocystis sp. subtype 4]|eukprot:XP_014529123.1 hypothetical protein JH06_0693 [Blastocystis sp. subtype 4]
MYLSLNFPACMTKANLIHSIKENAGVVKKKTRRELIDELETIILFAIRDDSRDKCKGYNQLFYSPSEYVETNFDDDGELKRELKKRGLPCPK